MNVRAQNGNGDFGKWLANLAKVVWYVGVIAGATWYVAKWDRRTTDLEMGLLRVEAQVSQIRTDTITRAEYDRLRRLADREHQRLWTAIGKSSAAQSLEP